MTDAQIKSTAQKLGGLAELAQRVNAETAKTAPDASARPRRPRARKLRGELTLFDPAQQQLGPFETAATFFAGGSRRVIEISRITPSAIYYRLRGTSAEMCLPHAIAYQRATAAVAGFDTGPRAGPIKRGS